MNLFFIEVLCDYLSIRVVFFCLLTLFRAVDARSPMEMCANRFSFTHTLLVHLRFAFSQTIKFFLSFSFFGVRLYIAHFLFLCEKFVQHPNSRMCDKGERKIIIKMICKTVKQHLKCKISFFFGCTCSRVFYSRMLLK